MATAPLTKPFGIFGRPVRDFHAMEARSQLRHRPNQEQTRPEKTDDSILAQLSRRVKLIYHNDANLSRCAGLSFQSPQTFFRFVPSFLSSCYFRLGRQRRTQAELQRRLN